MSLVLYLSAVGIDEVELHPTELSTSPTVGASAKTSFGGIAQSRIANAKGTMNKHLQLDIGHSFVNMPYLFEREFTCQHHPCETQRTQPRHLLCRAVIGLRRSMESEGKPLNPLEGEF